MVTVLPSPRNFKSSSKLFPQKSNLNRDAHWRADIDGLRAVAVGAVVIFHLAQSLLPGGYVGVDIFFVISGYLISKNILRSLNADTFTVADFYIRRLRRIFPAYAVVLLFVLTVSIACDLPPITRDIGVSALASSLSVANIYFWWITDYFGQGAKDLPLLHTWSLSVEEQFYLIYPALVFASWKWFHGSLPAIIVTLFAVSLGLSIFLTPIHAEASFYLIHTRAWELLLGGILALRLFAYPRTAFQRNALSLTGIVLIILAMAFFSSSTPFPGTAAILPSLGAALVIYSGENGTSLISRLLSWKPVVFLGLISYSLYLWHWPLLSYQLTHHLLINTNSKLLSRSVVLLSSLVFATLSWWLIECPTRNRTLVSSKLLLACGASSFGAIAAASLALMITRGLPQRYPAAVVEAANYLDVDPRGIFREGKCFLSRTATFKQFDQTGCLPDIPNRPTYLLVGDSHAAHLLPGLRRSFPDANILQITGVMCPPIMMRAVVSRSCPELLDLAFDELARKRTITKAWLSARWNAGQLGYTPGWSRTWMIDLKKTIETLEARHIEAIIIGPSPEYQEALPRLLAEARQKNDSSWIADNQSAEPWQIDAKLSNFAAQNKLRYISLMTELCPNKLCRALTPAGEPILFDDSHLTTSGSIFATNNIRNMLR